MKKVMLALALAAFTATGAFAQANSPAPAQTVDKNAPKFSFIGGETYDFGKLSDQKDAEHLFKFKNTGKTPLIITAASASCGCTVPEFPKEPIMPGKEGQIKVTYHTAGKSGPFQKTVFIMSNASANNQRYEIYIKGDVTPGAPAPKG
ncbi:MAG: DUF1573 domain-containing protein [Bacteroidetes bacterium]|nr:DUF1573 domain-containing protein [Bacteroidota bacterium]